VVHGEVAGGVTRLETAELEAEEQRARRPPLDVCFDRHVAKASREVPDALARVILKAMAKTRDDRYASAAEMHDALAAIG
jgi:hypothetical protein